MRTLAAVIIGLIVSSLLFYLGDASFARVPIPGEAGTSRAIEVVALLWTFASIAVGSLVTVRIRKSTEAVAGFIVAELFFGVGLLHQFWHASTWYGAAAILLVIPAALLGAWIGPQHKFRATASA